MSMRILKVKFQEKDARVHIEYQEEKHKGKWDDHSLNCHDPAKPSFHTALQDLLLYGAAICELPDSYKERMKVSSVSFSYGGDAEVMGATITMMKELRSSNAPLVINTPHKPESSYTEDGDESNCLPTQCVHALYTLQEEAIGYIRGDRSQLELKLDGEKESDDQNTLPFSD
jgi:hypothetical protein